MSTPKRTEHDGEASDTGMNDLGDGGAAMHALRRSQLWEVEAGSPAGAVWFWRLEEDRT